MRTIDASSMIYAWDNYPVDQFPKLWTWMKSEVQRKFLSIPKVAFDEVRIKSPECAEWLTSCGVGKITESVEVLTEAVKIKELLGIKNDQYHPRGVGENDIIIIATAKIEKLELVSNESKQIRQPQSNDRLKIPAVCELPQVAVSCIDFVELIKSSGQVF